MSDIGVDEAEKILKEKGFSNIQAHGRGAYWPFDIYAEKGGVRYLIEVKGTWGFSGFGTSAIAWPSRLNDVCKNTNCCPMMMFVNIEIGEYMFLFPDLKQSNIVREIKRSINPPIEWVNKYKK